MSDTIENFIARWQGREGGQERANYALFLGELCAVLEVSPPDPANASSAANDYVFERTVREPTRDGTQTHRRIDLYKRDCFLLEAKQSRLTGDKKVDAASGSAITGIRGRRTADRGWDVLMHNARAQAENYVRLLPVDHEPPPFMLVCDVGHCIEIYANFRRDGKAYDQFPDRSTFRVYLEDLRDPDVRARLAAIWTDPMALDPARRSARVTRDIAERLAKVSLELERAGHPAEDVAMFLMRLLFTMFSEDIGLLPRDSLRTLLEDCVANPAILPGMLEDLWRAMDEGTFSATVRERVRRFNGEFFKDRRALPLGREEIGELLAAASRDWREVEPAIFGTLLEQALDPRERRRLGAHYTPRAYVERLVVATIIDPLRADWAGILSTVERQKMAGRNKDAIGTVQAFHDRLCDLRVLDPACGTGNFLYVALELMKRLEGEVLETIVDLGGQEALTGLTGHTVDPHQFLGLEINPRAAAIAELVLWIGHLQCHVRTKGGLPGDPVLRAFHNIVTMDAVLTFDGYPLPAFVDGRETYPNPRRPDWPAADFIVGNPPFVGGKDLRSRLPPGKAEALWAAHPLMNESADLVMYWWDRAAEILTRKGTRLRRFGFVTTNSISQVFQRRVMERHLSAKRPLSIVFAISDHPWTKQSRDSAAVRIAMTVAEAGRKEGVLLDVTSESGIDTDAPMLLFRETGGTVNSDLTAGVDVTKAVPLRAGEGICSPGVKLHGAGFIVTPAQAVALGLGKRTGLEKQVRPYKNGRDLTARSRGVMVIDLHDRSKDEVRLHFPEIYQHLQLTVLEDRKAQFGRAPTIDARSYLERWWQFGKTRPGLRAAVDGTQRYIATVETTKHRLFQFLDSTILPDNMIVAIANEDAFNLGVLSSSIHTSFALRAGGWLGIGNDPRYSKSRCFDPFPFPDATEPQKTLIRAIAEELDAHRKTVLADHAHLTLTGLYNVLERLRTGTRPAELALKERRIFDDGLVLILRELHDRLDHAVAAAYGWPATLAEDELLARLVALNRERAAEEKRGLVRWLRPDYQIPRFGTDTEKARQIEVDLDHDQPAPAKDIRTPFPRRELEQTILVMAALANSTIAIDAATIAAGFRPGRNVRTQIEDVLAAIARTGHASTTREGRFALERGDRARAVIADWRMAGSASPG